MTITIMLQITLNTNKPDMFNCCYYYLVIQ